VGFFGVNKPKVDSADLIHSNYRLVNAQQIKRAGVEATLNALIY
tara:strand:- start:362 stop:493 length:132 start_codon:yes stop_codon:yes gene_type:complete